jgi:hypothetical protein
MANEFLNRFSKYSNVELLKIIKQSEEFELDAVKAAREIIATRNITESDIREMNENFGNIQKGEDENQEKVKLLSQKVNNFFEPILQPRKEFNPNKWLNLILLVIAITYLWLLYQTIKYFIDFSQCASCTFDISLVANLATLLYTPFIFYFILKKSKWGWIFLFGDVTFCLLSILSQSYLFFKFQSIHQGNTAEFIWSFVWRLALLTFLLRPDVASLFNISHPKRKKYAIVISIASIVIIGVGYLI